MTLFDNLMKWADYLITLIILSSYQGLFKDTMRLFDYYLMTSRLFVDDFDYLARYSLIISRTAPTCEISTTWQIMVVANN